MLKVGVLALQGAVREHVCSIEEAVVIKTKDSFEMSMG